jgi:hypothetical protein
MPAERLRDGFRTLIDFGNYPGVPGVELWEISVTPGGIDGGGPNDTTTMRNYTWRTRQPKYLKTLTEFSFTAAYSPALLQTLVSMVNELQVVTATFPDGSTYTFWGWLNSFTPNEHVEGEQPTAEVTVVPSNQDTNYVEQDPILTPLP